MRSKEQAPPESAFFRSRAEGTWLIVPLEKARGELSELDLGDWQRVRHLWVVNPGGRTTKAVVRKTGLAEEEARRMPPGSWISFDGRKKFTPDNQG